MSSIYWVLSLVYATTQTHFRLPMGISFWSLQWRDEPTQRALPPFHVLTHQTQRNGNWDNLVTWLLIIVTSLYFYSLCFVDLCQEFSSEKSWSHTEWTMPSRWRCSGESCLSTAGGALWKTSTLVKLSSHCKFKKDVIKQDCLHYPTNINAPKMKRRDEKNGKKKWKSGKYAQYFMLINEYNLLVSK